IVRPVNQIEGADHSYQLLFSLAQLVKLEEIIAGGPFQLKRDRPENATNPQVLKSEIKIVSAPREAISQIGNITPTLKTIPELVRACFRIGRFFSRALVLNSVLPAALLRQCHLIDGSDDPSNSTLSVPEFRLVLFGIETLRRAKLQRNIHNIREPEMFKESQVPMGKQRQQDDIGLLVAGFYEQGSISIGFWFPSKPLKLAFIAL